MATIQEARANAVLNKRFLFDGVAMSRREWIEEQVAKGVRFVKVEVLDHAERQKRVNEYVRLGRNGHNGNECHPDNIRRAELLKLMETDPVKLEYRAEKGGGYWFVITKTEYDFALTLIPVSIAATSETVAAAEVPLLPQTASPALLDTLAQGMREHKAKYEYIKILSVKVDFDKLDTVTLEVPTLYCILNSIKGFLQDSIGMDEERDRQLSAVDASLETLRNMEREARDRDILKRRLTSAKA